MKNVISILIFVFLFTSCKKDNITPGNYQTAPATPSQPYVNQYATGGMVPTPTNVVVYSELVGTKWVLTKIVTGLSNTTPNDTIRFIDNSHYTINNGALKSYRLTAGVASTNKTLSLYYFYPFGGSHYSGEVGGTFVSDGVINMCEFMNIQNSTDKIKAWFKKI